MDTIAYSTAAKANKRASTLELLVNDISLVKNGTGSAYLSNDGTYKVIATAGGDINVDGGGASEVYLPSQILNGGTA
jgi:hypothetical protein